MRADIVAFARKCGVRARKQTRVEPFRGCAERESEIVVRFRDGKTERGAVIQRAFRSDVRQHFDSRRVH